MMRAIIAGSLKYRILVLVVAIATLGLGIAQLRAMPVDALPEFTPTTVEVQTEALGLSAAEVEELITVPMEQDLLNGVAWLDEIRSESVTGLSRIQLIFEPGTDPLRARQVVQERLNEAHALPNVSKPPQMLQPLSSTSRFMMIRLSSQNLSPIEMSVLAHWTIVPRLMGVAGVANVSEWGHRERQLQVQVDLDQLQQHDVSLLQVIETTGNALWVSPLTFLEASTPGTAGFFDTANQRIAIQHFLPVKTTDDLEQVPIDGSEALRLGDVASVVEDHQPLIGDAVSADGQSVLLVVEKFPETNTLAATRGVEEALHEMQPGLAGLEMDTTVYRSASFIEMAIDNLTLTLLLGALFLVLLLVAFLFDWRSALVAAVAIPLSLVVAGLILYLRGATFNLLLLAGFVVALGVVIDDAVIGVDTIVQRLRQHRRAGSTKSTASIILDASLEVRSPIAYATLILLVAATPILFLTGLTREFSRPLVLSYALALVASMLVAVIVTPALSLLLLSRAPHERRESPLVRWLQRGYDRVLPRFVTRPRLAYAAIALVVVAGLAMATGFDVFPQRGGLPTLQDRNLLIRWEGVPGTSETEMRRITARVSQELQSVPGVRNVGAHIGRAVMADQVVNINAGELWVSIDPDADYDKTLTAVRETVDGYPGLSREVLTYPEEKLRETETGSSEDIVVRVYGEDFGVLSGKAEEVRQLLSQTGGVVDAQVELPMMQPQLEIEVDLATAQQYGIKPGDVRRAAATLLSGILVGNLFEDQKVFEVVVWGQPETRQSITSIRDLMIDTPAGGQVRLGEVADVRVASTPNVIRHDAVRTYVDVTANVGGRDVNAVANDVEERLQGLDFPLEFHAEVLGGYAERQSDRRILLVAAVTAAVGIFLLLQACFGSWRLATLFFLTLPTALVGGVLVSLATGGDISLGSLAGFLALLGIAGRNGITLIRNYQHLEREEGEPFGLELIRHGARERLAPILMTALGTALALVPLVVAGSVPGNEIVHPMAVVILGGLVTSTLLNLFVLPSLYLRFAPSARTQMEDAPLSISPSMSPASASD
jgi:CzcA family heavy metal efflux pump